MHVRLRTSLVAAVITTALVGAGCSSPTSDTGGGGDGGETVVNFGLGAKPTHFNPLAPFAAADTTPLILLQDTLLMASQEGKYEGHLAEDWSVSKDAKTFTFQLRKGIKWSDGEPFTAEDVVFTLNLFANPDVASPQSTRLSEVAGYQAFQDGKADSLSGVQAKGDSEVVVTLSTPDAGFLSLLAAGMYFFILPEHVLGKVEPSKVMEDDFFFNQTVGMGPYTWVDFKPDQRVELKKNPNYWRGEVSIDRVNLNIVTTNVVTAQLETGELDVANFSATDLETVEAMENVDVHSAPTPGFMRLTVNLRKPYLQDRRVRQAMMYALDREGIIKASWGGKATVQNSAFMTDWAMPGDLNEYPYDPQEAKDLLAQAGWDANRELTIPVPSTNSGDRNTTLNILLENFKDVGIKAKLRPVDTPKITDALSTGDYDLYLFGGGVYPIDPATDGPILTCDQSFPKGGNLPNYCNDEFDQLMKKGLSTSDRDQRATYYKQAVTIENRDVPYLWIARTDLLMGVNKRIKDFVPWGDAAFTLIDIYKWSVSDS